VVLGIVSYVLLGVDLFPKADIPVVSVMASLPGASTEELETTVTRPIEEAINTVSLVDELRSVVREGVTTVMLIAAMVPTALGQGPGAGARASMAKVIIGGQLLSLLLALLVTPVTYSLFDGLSRRLRGVRSASPPSADVASAQPAMATES
jgi:multidrug efflux pump subunit AcrB